MSTLPRMTYAEYLTFEAASDEKHEYWRGEVWARGGTPTIGDTPAHARLQLNAGIAIGTALKGKPCSAYGSDLRVRVEATDRTSYPDVTVVCGKLELSKDDRNAVTNPTLIVEILSEGTEAADRGERFAHYGYLPSLKEYVLVSQHTRRVEVFRRREGVSWHFTPYTAGAVPLEALGVSIEIDELYADPNS